MEIFKKILNKKIIPAFVCIFLISASSGYCAESNNQVEQKQNCIKENQIQKEASQIEEKNNKKPCETCLIDEDDEYCVYNQCYFDSQYRTLKRLLCLSTAQEECFDKIYKNFKSDMEMLCEEYRNIKNDLLEKIACDNPCYKEIKNDLKYVKNDIKEKYSELNSDLKDVLCSNQKSIYKEFQKIEKRKIKEMIKYGMIYKFPCKQCNSGCCP